MHGSPSVVQHPVFRVELVKNNQPVAFETIASPSMLRLKTSDGEIDLAFQEIDQIRFQGRGVSIRFVPVGPEVVVPNPPDHWEMYQPYGSEEKYMLWPVGGSLHVSEAKTATFAPDASSGRVEGEIDTYDSVWVPHNDPRNFETVADTVRAQYHAWLQRMPEVDPEFGPGAELASYVNWSSAVSPMGFLARPAMLMSKNRMAKVWSWDHSFNAMALAEKDPELAWQQYMVVLDNQELHGALPDGLRENVRAYTHSKPPIHGWALAWMMRHGDFSDRKHLEEAYGPLVKWTEWYFRYRDSNHNGIPEYDYGNDSGWDNSTAFLEGIPIEAPDLSSFLVLQMDTLATMAEKLGKKDEAREWHKRSDSLLKLMLDHFWRVDHFVAFRVGNAVPIESESLLLYMPLVLGNKLPVGVQTKLIEGLTRPGRFRTPHGFASEAITSKHYTPDGYWRGPIWAPSSMLLAEGLDSMGQRQLARRLRVDFCNMAQKSGMSENFDAVTGAALRDTAYTWTSSVYLIFAHELRMRRQ
jgi:glycogen debranching enzyme